MSLINRHRAAAGETPEQTLARLAAASRVADGPAPDQPRRPRFKVVKMAEGYNMAEVDAFIDTIDQRTADEVREVHFSTVRLTRGYDEDEVDRFLDEQVAHLGDDGCVEPRTSSPRPAGGKVLPPVKKSRKWIGLCLAGAACLVLGGSMLTDAVLLYRGGEKTTAVVLGTHYSFWSEEEVATIEYQVDGATYHADVTAGDGQIGDQVAVTYDPNDPENVTAGSSIWEFGWPLVVLAGGVWLVVCGLLERKDPRWV